MFFGLNDVAFLAAVSAPALDPDAAAYIAAVEAADTQALEPAVRTAINDFVVGCKADGIWAAIKASCILAGARTLTGALVPLVGAAPTNINFVSGDYNRKTGLVGDGSTKYLNSNRNNNADPQDNKHISVFVSTSAGGAYSGAGTNTTGDTGLGSDPANSRGFVRLNNALVDFIAGAHTATGFAGLSRAASGSYTARISTSNTLITKTSETPSASGIFVFARGNVSDYSASRLAFYSIGESLNLALLDARVTALINAIAAVIP